MRSLSARLALTFLLVSFAPTRALAHPSPQVLRILWRDTSDQQLFLVTNRGFVFGDLSNQSWRLLCSDVLDITSSETPDAAILSDGRILLATSVGLKATSDAGCSWQAIGPAGDLLIPAMAVAASTPERLYITTFPRDSKSAAGMGQSAIRVSDDGAATWHSVLMNEDDDFVRALRIAPGAPNEIYAAGTVYASAGRTHYITHSSDAGMTWTRTTIMTDENTEDVVRLLAVSPTHPELVVAVVLASEPTQTPERLLISSDGAKTFASPLSTLWLSDATFSDDGSTLWIASQDGLFRGKDPFTSFDHLGASTYMSLTQIHASTLFVSGRYEGINGPSAMVNGIATSSDEGESFTKLMNLLDITEPVDCGAGSNTDSVCLPIWQHWQGEVLGVGAFALGGLDAGVGAAGASAIDAGTHEAGVTANPNLGGSGAASVSMSASGAGGAQKAAAGSGGAAGKARSSSGCACVDARNSRAVLFGYLLLSLFPAAWLRIRVRGARHDA